MLLCAFEMHYLIATDILKHLHGTAAMSNPTPYSSIKSGNQGSGGRYAKTWNDC
jgi:hypothetical protein